MPKRCSQDRDPLLIVCQGRPLCLLENEAAEKAQNDGCTLCDRYLVHPDGSMEPTTIGSSRDYRIWKHH